jgi:cellulose synthase/poly-beta-1,6-N-acetylglucosamine synthase-like glycosyltransferase
VSDWQAIASWLAAASAVLLVLAYGVGAPFLLLRTLLSLGRRRRLRYRTKNDDILATSRFTIPVSLVAVMPPDAADASGLIRRWLQLRYPELELVVVVGEGPALDELKHVWELTAAEVFYRKSLPGAAVCGLYRSTIDPRVIVVHAAPSTAGEALNCGVNLARYRYVAITGVEAAYNADALLEAMHAALEDPQRVVGAATWLTVGPLQGIDAALRGEATSGPLEALRYLTVARARLTTIARRRLDLPPEGCPGLTVWRRDAVLEVGGFANADEALQADMTLRVHAHYRGDRSRYRVIHVADPVGTIEADAAERVARESRVTSRVLWRHRSMFLNATLGRLGLFDLPRYAFNLLVAPWIELAALVLLGLAVPLGVLGAGELLLVLFTIGLGNGILVATALLLSGLPHHDPRPAALFNLLLLAPFEYFVSRPSWLIEKFRRV